MTTPVACIISAMNVASDVAYNDDVYHDEIFYILYQLIFLDRKRTLFDSIMTLLVCFHLKVQAANTTRCETYHQVGRGK